MLSCQNSLFFFVVNDLVHSAALNTMVDMDENKKLMSKLVLFMTTCNSSLMLLGIIIV